MRKKRIVKLLVQQKKEIIHRLQRVVDAGTFDYTTFGKSIESNLIDIILAILRENELITSDDQYRCAKDKNEFPDLTFLQAGFVLDSKAGNRSKKKDGVWKPCKNSHNDLVTLNSLQDKLDKFGGENIYFVFVEYDFTDTRKKIIDIKIAPFYEFVGLNTAGLLSYREKDGNLRPKDFDEPSPITSLKQFTELIAHTNYYRSKRIIAKHRSILNKLKTAGFIPRRYRSKG